MDAPIIEPKSMGNAAPLPTADPKDLVYMHSRCCMGHWELTYNPDNGEWGLLCEKCGAPCASEVIVRGPRLAKGDCECEVCKCEAEAKANGPVAESADAQDSKSCSCRSEGSKPSGATNLGSTGEYPNGKLCADDEGELAIGVGVNLQRKLISLDFGKPVTWLAMSKQDILSLAEHLTERANTIPD